MAYILEPETYRSVDDADAYFANQLYATDWTGASDSDKATALLMASRAVDSLKYEGVKRSVWEAMIARSTGDATKTTAWNLSRTDLTVPELEAAAALQLKQFPRDDEQNAEAWNIRVNATGGTYDLRLNGELATGINFAATAAEIRTALEGLAAISVGDVTVALANDASSHDITMSGNYATSWHNVLIADSTSLTGGDAKAYLTTKEDNVPDAIFYAVCEEAKSLLSGRDAEQEFRNLELNSDGLGTNRVTMDRSGIHPEHSHHLVTSPLAWKYITRYLGNNNSFTVKRS